ncbi:MAG: hypothetical protein RR356_02990 [Bacteroidales bacterium]
MNRMRIFQFAVICALLCSFGILKAQNDYDHLEPVGGIYDIYNYEFEYYSKVREILFNGLTDKPEIRFQVMASFTPESVLDIQFDRDNNKYYIICHVCEKMIWHAYIDGNNKWKNIKVNKFKTEIDKESVELIKSLFEIAIIQVKYRKEEIIGLDGTDYYFSVDRYGLKSGKIWSPSKMTKIGRLVDVGDKLIELAKSKKEKVKLDERLEKEIEEENNRL